MYIISIAVRVCSLLSSYVHHRGCHTSRAFSLTPATASVFCWTCFYPTGIYEICSGPKLTRTSVFPYRPFIHLLTKTSRAAQSLLTNSSRSVLDSPQTLRHSRNLSLSSERDSLLPCSQQPTS
jgi:hypothetical protein